MLGAATTLRSLSRHCAARRAAAAALPALAALQQAPHAPPPPTAVPQRGHAAGAQQQQPQQQQGDLRLSAPPAAPPPEPTRAVIRDEAGVLGPDELLRVRAAAATLERDAGAAATVVVLTALPAGASTRQHASELAEATGGRRLLLLLALEERTLEVVTAGGLRLSDAWLERMLEEHVAPLMRDGAAGRGVAAALERCAERARSGEDEGEWSRWFGPREAAIGAAAVLAAYLVSQQRREATRARCPVCGGTMRPLPRETVAPRLSAGQSVEARLGSVTFTALRCGRCSAESPLYADANPLSQYVPCERCGARAAAVTRTERLAATAEAEGTAHVEVACAACGRRHAYDETLPRTPPGGSGQGGATLKW